MHGGSRTIMSKSTRRRFLGRSATVLATAGAGSWPALRAAEDEPARAPGEGQGADLALLGGRVYTVDERQPRADSEAIESSSDELAAIAMVAHAAPRANARTKNQERTEIERRTGLVLQTRLISRVQPPSPRLRWSAVASREAEALCYQLPATSYFRSLRPSFRKAASISL